MSSFEKWPAHFSLVLVSESLLGDAFEIYMMIGQMNGEQLSTLRERCHLHTQMQTGPDQYVTGCLLTKSQLEEVYDTFLPLAARFRGQYYVVANKIVEAIETVR